MAKIDRMERLDTHRSELEAEYTAELVKALRVTAAGRWGLFDQQGDRHARKAVAPVIASLTDLAGTIDRMREQLMMPPFELHQQFMAARGPVSSQAPGEPKQAQAWLERLAGA